MKSCSYCGRGYADDVAICPVDSQPVVSSLRAQGISAASPQTLPSSFDVRLISPILSAGTYRVYVERSDLLFIQIEGGSRHILEASAPLLGPLGFLVPLVLWLFTRGKARTKRQRLETGDAEDLFHESEKNFRLHLAEIREVTIEAPTSFSTNKQAARLTLLVRHGEIIKCGFENIIEVNKAIRVLAPLLNATLMINAVWNAEKQRFEKKKKDLTR